MSCPRLRKPEPLSFDSNDDKSGYPVFVREGSLSPFRQNQREEEGEVVCPKVHAMLTDSTQACVPWNNTP